MDYPARRGFMKGFHVTGDEQHLIQRQLGHASLGTTSIYLQRIDPEEIIAPVHMGRAPMMSASAGMRL
jgi:integrase